VNIALAFAWAALTASFTLPSLIVGYALGYGALWLAQPLYGGSSGYFGRTWRSIRLAVLFLYELIVSSIVVVWDVLTPEHKSRPQILEMPLEVESDFAILLVTNLISLTPGTLSLDVTPDRRRLIVHAMFADDPEAVIAGLKRFERWVKEVVE
jgi:multicomponent Na+:H+ antiporter subunit E